MKVGVIGAGYWGSKHIEEYQNLGHQVIVYDLLKENLQRYENMDDVITVPNYKDILLDEKIEYVSICTPNQTHFVMGKEAIIAGKNVLIEKPLAVDSSKASELYKLAKKMNVKLMVGHIFRFNNVISKTKQILKENSLGKIFHVRFDWHQMTTTMRDKNIILDIGLHPLDIIYFLFESKPIEIVSIRRSFRNKFSEVAILYFTLNIPKFGKIFITIDLSWISPIRSRTMTIIGNKKTLRVMCVDQKISMIDNETEKSQEIDVISNNTLQDELKYFLNCDIKELVNGHEKPNGTIGADVIKMVEKASGIKTK
jgi:predicted dehydrogenase